MNKKLYICVTLMTLSLTLVQSIVIREHLEVEDVTDIIIFDVLTLAQQRL